MGTINLNAKEFGLRYTIRDGIELRKRLGRPGVQIMRDLVGLDSGGQFALTFDIEALAACIVVGIRHQQKATEDTVIKWIQEHIDNGRLLGDLAGPVVEAMNTQGCFGFKLKNDEPEEPGKAETTETVQT
jgi:hypothetical protein